MDGCLGFHFWFWSGWDNLAVNLPLTIFNFRTSCGEEMLCYWWLATVPWNDNRTCWDAFVVTAIHWHGLQNGRCPKAFSSFSLAHFVGSSAGSWKKCSLHPKRRTEQPRGRNKFWYGQMARRFMFRRWLFDVISGNFACVIQEYAYFGRDS